MHFEILCLALSYEASLLMFRRFLWLARNGDLILSRKLSPEVHELERELLLRLRAYRTKLRAYPEELLVVLGISQDWVDSGFEPVFFVD
ncbi:hypothetical protein Hanom_Chr14g01275321 [Helianthus anomalus]